MKKQDDDCVILDLGGEPRINNPEPFFGDQEKFQDFVQQLHLVFNTDPTRYSGTQAKLSYAASYLRGAAKKWFTPHVDEMTGVISFATFEIFIVALKATFDDPDPDATAQRKLRELTQGSDPASTYHSKFITVLGKLNVTDTSRIAAFRYGLNEPIKDLLVGKQVPVVFDEFVQFCIRLDNDYRARQKEKKSSPSNFSFRQVHPSDRINSSRSNKPPSQFFKNRTFGTASHFPPMTQNPSTATGTHSGPMDLSAGRRGPLTDSEAKWPGLPQYKQRLFACRCAFSESVRGPLRPADRSAVILVPCPCVVDLAAFYRPRHMRLQTRKR